MWSVNMQHFIDEKGSTSNTPVKAKASADHFGAMVTAVTLDFTGRTLSVAGITCRNPKMSNCCGIINASLGVNLDRVDWYCSNCDDSGVITGWEDTLWDCTEEALNRL